MDGSGDHTSVSSIRVQVKQKPVDDESSEQVSDGRRQVVVKTEPHETSTTENDEDDDSDSETASDSDESGSNDSDASSRSSASSSKSAQSNTSSKKSDGAFSERSDNSHPHTPVQRFVIPFLFKFVHLIATTPDPVQSSSNPRIHFLLIITGVRQSAETGVTWHMTSNRTTGGSEEKPQPMISNRSV